jgi:hypothetical protein
MLPLPNALNGEFFDPFHDADVGGGAGARLPRLFGSFEEESADLSNPYTKVMSPCATFAGDRIGRRHPVLIFSCKKIGRLAGRR